METSMLEVLAARVAGLERENFWLKRIGAGSILGILALIALGTSAIRAPREISAEKFVLRDSVGRARAKLEVSQNGPLLSMLTPEGTDQLKLGAYTSGITTLDFVEGRDLRASFCYYPEMGASVNLFDRNRRSRAEMFVNTEGGSGIGLHRYQRGIGLGLEPDGGGRLSFMDRTGEERAGMALAADGRSTLLNKPESESEAISLEVPASPIPAEATGEEAQSTTKTSCQPQVAAPVANRNLNAS